MFFNRGFNKKAVSEITTFTLLTLLIVVASLGAYVYSQNFLDVKQADFDLKKAEAFLKKFDLEFSQIKNFDGSSFSLGFSFDKGQLKFSGNQVRYISMVDYTGENYCFDIFCIEKLGTSEVLVLNLSSGFVFEENFTLEPQNYILFFKNVENESKISVTFK